MKSLKVVKLSSLSKFNHDKLPLKTEINSLPSSPTVTSKHNRVKSKKPLFTVQEEGSIDFSFDGPSGEPERGKVS